MPIQDPNGPELIKSKNRRRAYPPARYLGDREPVSDPRWMLHTRQASISSSSQGSIISAATDSSSRRDNAHVGPLFNIMFPAESVHDISSLSIRNLASRVDHRSYYKTSPLLSCERRCDRAVRALRCSYGTETRKTEHDLPAAVADLRISSNPAASTAHSRLMHVLLVLCIRTRANKRAVRDRPRLPQLLSDAGFLPQEAAVIRTRRLALQKCQPVAQVIKDLEEEIPVQILGRAPSRIEARRAARRRAPYWYA